MTHLKRVPSVGLVALFALGFAQEPGTVIYKGKSGELRIDHFAKSDLTLSGNATFTGNPVIVSWKDRGISFSANRIEGESTLDDRSGNYFLKTGKLSGSVVFVQDSEMARAYAIQRAKELGIQPEPITSLTTKASFSSQEMTYAGDPNVGTLTIPTSFKETYAGHGTESVKVGDQVYPRDYIDSGEMSGSSGIIEFSTQPSQTNSLRKATIQGPISFNFGRNGTLNGKSEPPIAVSGVAERLDADFLGTDHTVTLTGNVQLQTQFFVLSASKEKPGTLNYQPATVSNGATKAVLFFGPKNELLRIEMEGSPSVTNIKPLKPLGGGI